MGDTVPWTLAGGDAAELSSALMGRTVASGSLAAGALATATDDARAPATASRNAAVASVSASGDAAGGAGGLA